MAIVTDKNTESWLKTAKKAVKNNILPRQDTPLWDLLPYKRRVLDKKGHTNILELTEDRGFAALLNIPGKDLDFMAADGEYGAGTIIQGFHHLLNVYVPDWSAIITQLPADTTKIQVSWNNELALIEQQVAGVKDERIYNQLMARRELCEHQINVAKNVASQMKHQEYTGIVYGTSLSDVIENQRNFIQQGGSAVAATPLSGERVEQILKLLNDPTTDID